MISGCMLTGNSLDGKSGYVNALLVRLVTDVRGGDLSGNPGEVLLASTRYRKGDDFGNVVTVVLVDTFLDGLECVRGGLQYEK